MTTASRPPRDEDADRVASPCISVCKMDDASGLCIGCLRTLDEIAAWSVLDADAKRAVIASLAQRRAVHPEFAGKLGSESNSGTVAATQKSAAR